MQDYHKKRFKITGWPRFGWCIIIGFFNNAFGYVILPGVELPSYLPKVTLGPLNHKFMEHVEVVLYDVDVEKHEEYPGVYWLEARYYDITGLI